METTAHNILVVEDDDIILKTTQKVFAKHGYNVDGAIDGMAAMEKLMNGQYDVVVTDLNMPQVTGQQLIQAIKRNRYNNVKVIVCSSTSKETVINEALEMGADDYLIKPYMASELLVRVQTLLARRAEEQENS